MSWRQRLAELMVAGTVASGVSSCMNCNLGPRPTRCPPSDADLMACFAAGGVGLDDCTSDGGGHDCHLDDGGTLTIKDGQVQGP